MPRLVKIKHQHHPLGLRKKKENSKIKYNQLLEENNQKTSHLQLADSKQHLQICQGKPIPPRKWIKCILRPENVPPQQQKLRYILCNIYSKAIRFYY